MSKPVVRWILATLVFLPSVAAAQERGDVGVFMGYPSRTDLASLGERPMPTASLASLAPNTRQRHDSACLVSLELATATSRRRVARAVTRQATVSARERA